MITTLSIGSFSEQDIQPWQLFLRTFMNAHAKVLMSPSYDELSSLSHQNIDSFFLLIKKYLKKKNLVMKHISLEVSPQAFLEIEHFLSYIRSMYPKVAIHCIVNHAPVVDVQMFVEYKEAAVPIYKKPAFYITTLIMVFYMIGMYVMYKSIL